MLIFSFNVDSNISRRDSINFERYRRAFQYFLSNQKLHSSELTPVFWDYSNLSSMTP